MTPDVNVDDWLRSLMETDHAPPGEVTRPISPGVSEQNLLKTSNFLTGSSSEADSYFEEQLQIKTIEGRTA